MKVSIVVTVLNEEKSIEILCTSLLSQSLKCDDIIIVDGGSTDKTLEILKNYPQIKLFKIKGNRSIGRNYGIEKSKGEVIAVTDAGGYPQKDWLEKIIKPFQDRKVEIVSGYYKSLAKTLFEKCVTPYFLVMKPEINAEFLASSRSIAFRKSVWEKQKYPEEYSYNEDLVWDYKLKEKGYSFYFEPKAIVYWSPPQNILRAAKTFYNFALGDAQANIYRPTVQFIYYRYLAAALVLGIGKYALALIPLVFLYFLWAIIKNYKYVKAWQAFFILPIIQVTSDVSIMWGHLVGKLTDNL